MGAVTGCSVLPETYTPVGKITAEQTALHDGLEPYATYSVGLKYSQPVPARAAKALPRLLREAELAVGQWHGASTTWRLPEEATDGVPALGTVAALSDALRFWSHVQHRLLDVLVPCAGKVRMDTCLRAHEDVYADWKHAAIDVAAAEDMMVNAANDSHPTHD